MLRVLQIIEKKYKEFPAQDTLYMRTQFEEAVRAKGISPGNRNSTFYHVPSPTKSPTSLPRLEG
jgi:hypothetical protein